MPSSEASRLQGPHEARQLRHLRLFAKGQLAQVGHVDVGVRAAEARGAGAEGHERRREAGPEGRGPEPGDHLVHHMAGGLQQGTVADQGVQHVHLGPVKRREALKAEGL